MSFSELDRPLITDKVTVFHDMVGFYFHGLLKRYFSHLKSVNWHKYLSSLEFYYADLFFFF